MGVDEELLAGLRVLDDDHAEVLQGGDDRPGLDTTGVQQGALAFQPRAPVRTDPRGPATRRQQINHFVHRSALPSFLITLLTWALLNQFRALTYDGDNPNRIHGAIIAVQQLVAWAAAALFVVAVAVGLHALISQLRTVDT